MIKKDFLFEPKDVGLNGVPSPFGGIQIRCQSGEISGLKTQAWVGTWVRRLRGSTSMPESPSEVVRAFVSAINAGNVSALRALMTDDHTFTDARGNSFSGAEKMYSGWQHFFHAYPDYKISVNRTFADGNQVALFGEASGKWRVNEGILPQSWKVAAAWLAEVETGKIKTWSVFCDTSWASPPR